MNNEEEVTDVWRDYEKGKNYNRMKNLYTDTDQNYDFYHGDQAKYLNIGNETPIVFNIIKSIVKYKLGVVNSNAYAVVYNPNFYKTDTAEEGQVLQEYCKKLSKNANKVWELQQIDNKFNSITKDACINSEGIMHNYWEKTKKIIEAEEIDKNNIYYGNENDDDIQNQPYIIISYRRPVTEVRDYAKTLGLEKDVIDMITPDEETLEQAGYKSTTDEVNPMCLVLLKYYKKDGKVYYTRAVKSVTLEKDIYTGLTLYPIAHMLWEKKKGSARGEGAVKCIIPNQIEINKIATRRALAVKLASFPKKIVNKDFIANPSSLDKVGTTISIKGGAQVDDVRKYVGYLIPAQMSSDAQLLQNDLKDTTRDLEGAGDVATGTVDPTQASGKAILAVQQATQQPLNEQVNTFKTFVEDEARIWFDMWKTYEDDGLTIIDEQEDDQGNKIETPITISKETLNSIEAQIKVDITPKTPYDRYAEEQSLENLFMNDKISFEEYVDALPDGSVMPKDILKKIIDKRKENQQKMANMEMQVNAMNSAMSQVMQMQSDDSNKVEDIANQGEQINANLTGGSKNEMSPM